MEKRFIDELPNICVNLDLVSVYDIDCYTIPELCYMLMRKINDVICTMQHNDGILDNDLKELKAKVDQLLAGGLEDEVRLVLEQMYNDGRLTQLVQEAIADVHRKMNEVLEEVNDLRKKEAKYCTISATRFPHWKLEDYPRQMSAIKRQNIDLTYCDMVGVSSPTDINLDFDIEGFKQSIKNIQANGIKVKMVKPHIGVDKRDDFYRPNYRPSNLEAFFTNWENLLVEYAKVCNELNIPILCISCEMDYCVQDNTIGYWRRIESRLKNLFPNLLLTHSFTSTFWGSSLQPRQIYTTGDFIGINVYLSLTNKKSDQLGVVEVEEMIAQDLWGVQTCKVASWLSRTYNKRIFITETGCIDTDLALFSASAGGSKDHHRAQYLFHNMMAQGVYSMEEVVGFALWHVDDPWRYYEIDSVTQAEQVISDFIEHKTKL